MNNALLSARFRADNFCRKITSKRLCYCKKLLTFFTKSYIFFDGLVGGAIRIGNGKSTLSKVVGWILFISFILNIISFAVAMPAFIAWVLHILYAVCWIADIITVAVSKKITLFM